MTFELPPYLFQRALATGKHQGVPFNLTPERITRQALDFDRMLVTVSDVDGPQSDGRCEVIDALRLDEHADLVIVRLQSIAKDGTKIDFDQAKWNLVGSVIQASLKKCRQYAVGAIADLDKSLNGKWLTVALKKDGASWEPFSLGINCVQWTGRDNQYALLMDGYLGFVSREKMIGAIGEDRHDKKRLREIARMSDSYFGDKAYLVRPPAGFAAAVRTEGKTVLMGFDLNRHTMPTMPDNKMFVSAIDEVGRPLLGEMILVGGHGDQWSFKRGRRADFPEHEEAVRIY